MLSFEFSYIAWLVTKRQRSSSETLPKKRQRRTSKVNIQSENQNFKEKSSITIQQNGRKSSGKSAFSVKEDHHIPRVYDGINHSSQIDSSVSTRQHHIYMNYRNHHVPSVHGGVPHGSQIGSSSSSAQKHPVHNNHHHDHWIPRFQSSGVNRYF